MNGHKAIERAKKAHERRWGKSTLPIKGTVCGTLVLKLDGSRYPTQWVRTVDFENGSVIDWDFSKSRLRRITEKQPQA